jgi:putative peptidoglycan lipid II flippase
VNPSVKLAGISGANMATTLLFHWLVVASLGPGVETDALFAGMTVPQLFTSVVSASLTHAIAPYLAGEPREEQERDSWTLLVVFGGLFVAAALLLIVTAEWWVPLLVPGFSPEGMAMTILFAQISAIGIVLTGVNTVQTAVAFAQNRFIWSDAAPLIASLVALVLLWLFLPRYGAAGAAWIVVLRLLVQSLLLMRGMGRPRRPDFSSPVTVEIWRRIRPLILGATYYKMDPIVDRILLSTLAPGALSLLYLAQQLYGAFGQIVVKVFAVPAITGLAIASKQRADALFNATLRKGLLLITIMTLLAIGTLAAVGRPVIELVAVHGAFTQQDGALLWWLLILISGQFIGGSLGSLTSGAFYATGDTKTPTIIGIVSFTISIGIKVASFILFDLEGLAVAISFYYMMSLAMMMAALYRRGLLGRANGT